MDKFKCFIYVIIFSVLLTGCSTSYKINKNDIDIYINNKLNIDLLTVKYDNNNGVILLYEDTSKYFVDYCQKNSKKEPLKIISRYEWNKTNADKTDIKHFGNIYHDYMIIIFKDHDLFKKTDKLFIKMEEIEFYHDITTDFPKLIIQLPNRPTILANLSVTLLDEYDEELNY